MSITREQLKVGETYVNENGDTKRKVVTIGECGVFYSITDKEKYTENCCTIENFLKHHSIIKPEPKKIGEVAWFRCIKGGEIKGMVAKSDAFNAYNESEHWKRVTIKDNEIWEFYE